MFSYLQSLISPLKSNHLEAILIFYKYNSMFLLGLFVRLKVALKPLQYLIKIPWL